MLFARKPLDNIAEEDLTDALVSDLSERIPLVSGLHAGHQHFRKEKASLKAIRLKYAPRKRGAEGFRPGE